MNSQNRVPIKSDSRQKSRDAQISRQSQQSRQSVNKSKNATINNEKINKDSNNNIQLLTQSTAAEKDNVNQQFNDCESTVYTTFKKAEAQRSQQNGIPTPLTADDDMSKQVEDQRDKRLAYGGKKSFSFVSVVLEPSKKNVKSMKARDRNKPLIDESVIRKQVEFQNRLLEYQQQMNMQSVVEFENENSEHNNKNRKKSKKNQNQPQVLSKVQRGNLGFCFLDMSLLNLCGVPSLWVDSKQYSTSGTTMPNSTVEPFIKPYQKKLLKKQYKVYELLKFHKIFENEKYFGKTTNYMHHHNNQTFFQDYYFFSTEYLKENNKYQVDQLQQVWEQQAEIDNSTNNSQIKEKQNVLDIIQSSLDVVHMDIPRTNDPEPAYFKLINSEAKILKSILTSQGIQQTDQNEWNILWTCVSLQNKQQIYEQMQDFQKINHFQNSTELTRKDRFSENIANMKFKFGFSQFDFVPETYQLPEENSIFQERFMQIKKSLVDNNDSEKDDLNSEFKEDNLWIVKPSQSSQGRGIYIVDDIKEIENNPNEKTVVCKYISNPLLINGHKFDLRIYVLVTCIDPLRIYIYNEGLARFASEPYDSSKNAMKNLYQHLTNYSINKKSETFTQNKSVLDRDHGNKWSMSALQSHLENMGINMQPIWERVYDSIIKSIISVEHHLQAGVKKMQNSAARTGCFELYGFDIILDTNFKPHILEVNFSPSLSADSPLDYHIKSNILVDTLNLVGLKRNPRKRGNKNGPQRFRGGLNINTGQQNLGFNQINQANARIRDNKMQKSNSNYEMRNFTQFLAQGNIDQYFLDRLSRISAKHRELVFETLDEFQRNKNMNYTCIYPAAGCHMYDKYFEAPRASNQLIHRYLFTKNELYTLTKQISEFQKQYLKSKGGDENSEAQKSQGNSENSDKDANRSQMSPSPTHASDQDGPRETNQTTSKLKKRRIQITENSPKVEVASNRSIDSQSLNSPKNTKTALPLKSKVVISGKKPESLEQQQAKEKTSILDSKALISSQTSKTQTRPKPLKTGISPNRNSKSPSPSLICIQVTKSGLEDPSPVKIQPAVISGKPDTESKFSSMIASPNLWASREREGTVDEISSPDIMFKDAQSNNKPKSKSRNDASTTKTSGLQSTIKNNSKKSKSKLGTQNLAGQSLQSQTFENIGNIASPKIELPQEAKKETLSGKITIQGNNQTLIVESPSVLPSTFEISESPLPVSQLDASPQIMASPNVNKEIKKEKQKMVITGDDILIEYVCRIGKLLDNFHHLYTIKQNKAIDRIDEIVPQQLRITLEKFTRHKIWSNKMNSQEQTLPLVNRLKMRHTEMVERRMKILKALLKKQNPNILNSDIEKELQFQDNNRDKIVNRISSQKIEKMVKQSNIENQIDIVSILVDGSYTLPLFMQTSGGKNNIQGTLSSLKLFEKILKSDEINSSGANPQLKDQTPLSKYPNGNGKDFRSESKQRETQASILGQSIKNNSSNQKIANNKESKYYSSGIGSQQHSMIDQSNFQEPLKKKVAFSNSISGTTSGLNNQPRAPALVDTNKTFDGINEIIGAVNSYLSTGSAARDGATENSKKVAKHNVGMSATHQKNSQSFINPELTNQNESYFGKSDDNQQKLQSFDKRQRSYRNEGNQIIKTKSSLQGRENEKE